MVNPGIRAKGLLAGPDSIGSQEIKILSFGGCAESIIIFPELFLHARSVTANIVSCFKRTLETGSRQFLGRPEGRADNDANTFRGEQVLRPRSHSSGDDMCHTLFGEPGGKNTGFVSRWNLVLSRYDVTIVVHVHDRKRITVTEVHRQRAVDKWNCYFHKSSLGVYGFLEVNSVSENISGLINQTPAILGTNAKEIQYASKQLIFTGQF